jgi:hypothetical protein
LSDADLRAADLWSADLWLSSLPRYGFSNQWPPPIRLPSWGSPLSPDEKKRLRARLETDITDGELLESVLAKLESILREDSSKWPDEIWLEAQRKEPRPREVVRFLAGMACGDPGGYIANSMSQRAVDYGKERDTYLYGMRLAKALLEENCKGAKSLSNETLAKLGELGNVDARVLKSMEAMKDKTAELGAPRVEGKDLYFGSYKVDEYFSAVDEAAKEGGEGMAAALFIKDGNDFIRITGPPDDEGTGGPIEYGPARASLEAGKAYYGEAPVLGTPYVSGYEPIEDVVGTVIGAYFVGYKK